MIAKPALLPLMLGATCLLYSAHSYAQQERGRYRGGHPIPAERAGSFCHIDFLHTHTYLPGQAWEAQFVTEGALQFVGDPTLHGYEGPVATYFGPHPARFEGGSPDTDVLCEIATDHFHLRDPLLLEDCC